jgi:DNA-binding transcriptional regulator/RsmH inhibitor MraZ
MSRDILGGTALFKALGHPIATFDNSSLPASNGLSELNRQDAIAQQVLPQSVPFVGHAILPVKRAGSIRLPDFVRRTMVVRHSPIFLGLHDADACLVGFTQSWHQRVTGELSRRHSDDLHGTANDDRSYARRVFGFCEQIWHQSGIIRLPDWAMATAGISDTVLIVGTGENFEIWSPQEAQQSSDKNLVALACSAVKFCA